MNGFDDWQRINALQQQSEFVPLAFWDPGYAVPAEFPFDGRNSSIPLFRFRPTLPNATNWRQ